MEDQGKRIVLFVVIAGAIFLGWQFLFPPAKPPKKAPVAATDTTAVQSPTWSAGSTAPPPAPGTGSAPAAGTATPPPAVQPFVTPSGVGLVIRHPSGRAAVVYGGPSGGSVSFTIPVQFP